MRDRSKLKFGIVAVFAATASLLLWTQSTSATSRGAAPDPSSPRSLYMQNCSKCHGADGKAQTRLGRKYDADDISGGVGVGKTTRIVTNGKGHMPSFKKRLTPAQIASIAGYVSGL